MTWLAYVYVAFILAICIATLVYLVISIAAAVKRLRIGKDFQKIVENMKKEENGDVDGNAGQN